MSRKKRREQEPESVPQRKRLRWLMVALIAATVIGTILASWPSSSIPPPTSDYQSDSATDPGAKSGKVAAAEPALGDPQPLVGRWLRPDGGYILEIRSATADGKLEARYFNPRSIHVARAEWQRRDGKLQVFVELQDVNYPGSTYMLDFSPAEPQLTGTYYQASQGETFAVEFVREGK